MSYMVEQLKQEAPAVHGTYLSASKLEKNGPKSRGSGSPFKCIGLGIAQQIKSEKEEEISAGRYRIEELEALAASRQKEIFLLNSRLAAAESMTHDVIRDLLGIKLDMNSCATTLLDNQQLQMLAKKAQLHNVEVRDKEQEVVKLKQQMNEFIKERKGWLIEIERKQAEMVAAQVTVEQLRQKDQLLTTENEMLKAENISHKERVLELETEVKKLSGQQRIHHHAKIKEENNLLRSQNDELIIKLRKMEALLTRVREELAHYRAANGRSACINFDEEQRLCNKLKETETERLQVAQELVGLCTSILKAAGITSPTSEISPSLAQEALEQMKQNINTLERELQDIKLKNRMNNERVRLSELMPETSPLRSREDQISRTQDRIVQTPFLSALDR